MNEIVVLLAVLLAVAIVIALAVVAVRRRDGYLAAVTVVLAALILTTPFVL